MGENSVARNVVLGVLAQYIKVSPTGQKDCYSVTAANGMCEVIKLYEDVRKRRLNDLSRKYGVPMRHWYNPNLVHKPAVADDQKVM